MTRYFLFALLLLPLCGNAQSIKNLDIKNGFLQFKLGDSISKYKSVLKDPGEGHVYYPVKLKDIPIKKYIQRMEVKEDNGIIIEIIVMAQENKMIDYMDAAFKQAYGESTETPENPDKSTTITSWTGKRVTATLTRKKEHFQLVTNASGVNYLKIRFTKTSDLKVEGTLPADFEL